MCSLLIETKARCFSLKMNHGTTDVVVNIANKYRWYLGGKRINNGKWEKFHKIHYTENVKNFFKFKFFIKH